MQRRRAARRRRVSTVCGTSGSGRSVAEGLGRRRGQRKFAAGRGMVGLDPALSSAVGAGPASSTTGRVGPVWVYHHLGRLRDVPVASCRSRAVTRALVALLHSGEKTSVHVDMQVMNTRRKVPCHLTHPVHLRLRRAASTAASIRSG